LTPSLSQGPQNPRICRRPRTVKSSHSPSPSPHRAAHPTRRDPNKARAACPRRRTRVL